MKWNECWGGGDESYRRKAGKILYCTRRSCPSIGGSRSNTKCRNKGTPELFVSGYLFCQVNFISYQNVVFNSDDSINRKYWLFFWYQYIFTVWLRLLPRLSLSLNFGLSTYLSQQEIWAKLTRCAKAYSISSSAVIVSKIAYHLDSAHRDHNTHRP